jgi:hypothetical protein
VVEDPLIPSGLHSLVCLGLDHSLGVDVDIDIEIDHLYISAIPALRPSYLRTLNPFSSQLAVLTSSLQPFGPP